jgi:hypothetical protein
MYKVFRAKKDTYITNKIVTKQKKVLSNVGKAGSLDLFKIYGNNFSGSVPEVELSRILIDFETSKLKELFDNNQIDISHPSFKCELKLFDVYGGQTTPSNFKLVAFPLSRSFSEGLGRDVVYYSDIDSCNFLTCSDGEEPWILPGAAAPGGATDVCDYYDNVNGISLMSEQVFETGEENVVIDVTKSISSSLKNDISSNGFRISFSDDIEQNNKTYFVKRFSSRHSFNSSKHPQLVLKFDDSIKSNTDNIFVDKQSMLNFYNYANNDLENITSSSFEITGSDSLKLRLETEVSGGMYSLIFSASQRQTNDNFVKGIYESSFIVPSSDSVILEKLIKSGSFSFTPIWVSNDLSFAFHTGSSIVVNSGNSSSQIKTPNELFVSCNIDSDIYEDEEKFVRVNIFDESLANIFLVKRPIESKNLIFKRAYYSIRNVITDEIIIPFDTQNNSTLLSNDDKSMFFVLDCASLLEGSMYVIDIMINVGGNKKIFKNASHKFKVMKR